MEPPEIHLPLGISVLRFADMQRAGRGGTHILKGLVKNCHNVPRMIQDDCSKSNYQASNKEFVDCGEAIKNEKKK